MKFTKVYMFGGKNGKDDPTDYLIGYESENGTYIDKRTSTFDSLVWYECEGHLFYTLKEAKNFVCRKL